MTASSEIKSCHEPVVDFEFNLESVKSNKWFRPKNIKVFILFILLYIKMAVLSKIKSYPSVVDYFKEPPFYN